MEILNGEDGGVSFRIFIVSGKFIPLRAVSIEEYNNILQTK